MGRKTKEQLSRSVLKQHGNNEFLEQTGVSEQTTVSEQTVVSDLSLSDSTADTQERTWAEWFMSLLGITEKEELIGDAIWSGSTSAAYWFDCLLLCGAAFAALISVWWWVPAQYSPGVAAFYWLLCILHNVFALA